MKNALTYITRKCPRHCEYCAIRNSKMPGELSPERWKEAFEVLENLGVDFNLILGNEAWLFGDKLAVFMKDTKTPYAIYTTASEPLFSKNVDFLLGKQIIDNLSCGFDFPNDVSSDMIDDDSYKKSQDAWKAFTYVRKKYPWVDTQGTMTVHRLNYRFLPKIVEQLQDIGVNIGVNFIHWDKDGTFDFFPRKEDIEELLFKESDYADLRKVLDKTLSIDKGYLQNPEFLKLPLEVLVEMGWHCQGDPYGGPTIDADGSLRVCGYRKGIYTSKFKIWDLKDPEKVKQWQEAVKKDAMECPGCSWSYPWMYHYWQNKEPEFGKDVFANHASKKLDIGKWKKRITDKY